MIWPQSVRRVGFAQQIMKATHPGTEHLRLCLQLVLHSYLHQLDVGFTDAKVKAVCEELGVRNIPETHKERLAVLQTRAAQLLSNFQ